jgi:hypothetical protein
MKANEVVVERGPGITQAIPIVRIRTNNGR